MVALLCTPFNNEAIHAAAAPKVTILLDGYPLPFPEEPIIIKGYTMVPFRAIAEAIGIKVQYENSSKRITATRQDESGSHTVVLQLNNTTAQVDGQPVKLAVPPQAKNGHTLIPLSFFSRQFGAGVGFENKTKTVAITSPKRSMYVSGYYALSSFSERGMITGMGSVAFGWSRIDRESSFTTEGTDFRWPRAAGEITPERIVQETAAAGTTPYLMVYATDGMLELTKVIEDSNLRQQTIDSIVDLAVQKGFQGVHLDFEGLGMTGDKQKVRKQFNEFVRLMSEQTRAANLKLSLALHPINSVYQGYDYRTLAAYADELVIMAYAYEDESRPEPMDKVDEAIRLALQETEAGKLVLGISMGSENAQSVNSKIGLAKRYNLKGIALWRLGLIGEEAFHEMKKSISF
ncbi:stalk domain-containing protein [Paenibacillus abyssi]